MKPFLPQLSPNRALHRTAQQMSAKLSHVTDLPLPLDGYSTACRFEVPRSIPGQSLLDLWWTK
jgi:hypothetical protein